MLDDKLNLAHTAHTEKLIGNVEKYMPVMQRLRRLERDQMKLLALLMNLEL